jgi:type I restriction enzyme S subunit
VWCRLNGLYNFIDYRGVTPQKIESGIPLVTAKNVKDGFIDYSIDEYISRESYEERKGRGVSRKGDILFTTEAPLGNAALADLNEYSAGQRLITFQSYSKKNELNNRLFMYFLLSSFFREQLKEKQTGTTVFGIKAEKLKQLILPVPPIVEQFSIASIIESAFTLIDDIERNKTDLQSAVSTAKSKILSLAIRGKLVPQDPDDEPASVLLDRIRAERETLIKSGKIKRDKGDSVVIRSDDSRYYRNLPQGWEITSLATITTPISLNDGDWILSENMSQHGEVKLIQLGSIGYMEYINKGFKYLTLEMFNKLKCTVISPSYLLINRLLDNKLNVCILPDIEGILITTVDTCWISPNDNYDLFFLMYSIAAKPFQDFVFTNSTGSTRKRISKGKLIHIPLTFPPLAEQHRIVAAIEKGFEYLDNINKNLLSYSL